MRISLLKGVYIMLNSFSHILHVEESNGCRYSSQRENQKLPMKKQQGTIVEGDARSQGLEELE